MSAQKLNVGFLTTVSGRWPQEVALRRDEVYPTWLNTFPQINVIKHDTIAVNNGEVQAIAEKFKKNSVDLVVLVIGAFTGDYPATYLAEELRVPIILWAPTEPPFDGGRLKSNALVSATMNAAALKRLGAKYHFVYGCVEDERAQLEIARFMRVYHALKQMKQTHLGLLGYRPTGFYSSTFDETLIRKTFGVTMEAYDLSLVFDMASKVSANDLAQDIQAVQKSVTIDKNLPQEYLENHSRLYLALKAFIAEYGFDALCIRCWPEMGNFKFTPCAVISRLADEGYLIGCESDVDVTLAMLLQTYLAQMQTWMADLITIDEKQNTALFWHCGQAGKKLFDQASQAEITDHPLAGQGTALQGTLKQGQVTIARTFMADGKYNLFITSGEALPTKKELTGVMVNVKLNDPVLKTVYRIAEEGVAHHYSLVWADVVEDMILLCKIVGVTAIQIS